MLILWVVAVVFEVIFLCMRIICNPIHYFGTHFVDLEQSFRYQVFLRGFQICFLKIVFCSLLNLKVYGFASRNFTTSSSLIAIGFLIFALVVTSFIFVYVYTLRKVPMYKMRRRYLFRMIYDDFDITSGVRFKLLFFVMFYYQRIFFAIILVFASDTYITALNLYIFLVCIVPMMYFSYCIPFKFVGLNALLCLNVFSETFVAVILMHY